MEKKKIKYFGATMFPKQLSIANQIRNSKTKYNILKATRGSGKSFMARQLLLNWMIKNPNTFTLYTIQTYKMARRVFEDTIKGIESSGIIKYTNKSQLEIILRNNSSVVFAGIVSDETLRGHHVDFMICDELAFYGKDVWNETLRPMTTVKCRKILILSTPRGKKNEFFTMYNNGKNPDKTLYYSYDMNWKENPFFNPIEMQDAKETIPDEIFRQEFGAEFIDDVGGLFDNLNDICILTKWRENNPSETHFAGLDLGRKVDYTVLTIFNSKGVMIDMLRVKKLEWNVIYAKIVEMLLKYNVKRCIIEINSLGDPIFDRLKELLGNKRGILVPFSTYPQSKQDLIDNLIISMYNKEFLLPNKELEPIIREEFGNFTFEYNEETRKITYKAIPGFHDDIVMSVALGVRCLRLYRKKSISYDFVNIKR